MPPKNDPNASTLKEVLYHQGNYTNDDGLNTRQRLRAKRREEGKQLYEKELPELERKAKVNPIVNDRRHQQIDKFNDKPCVTNLVNGRYYEPKQLANEPKVVGFQEEQQPIGSDDSTLASSSSHRGDDGCGVQAPEEAQTQTVVSSAATSSNINLAQNFHRLPYPIDDRQGSGFRLGPKPASVQTAATGRTVRNVGCEVTPDELYVKRPDPAPWDKVPEETKKGREPVTKDLDFVAERTIQTETDLKGHFWDRNLSREEMLLAGGSARANQTRDEAMLMAAGAVPPQKEPMPMPGSSPQRPQSSSRFKSRPQDTVSRLF